MRDYGKIYSSFWASQNIRDLSEDGRVLAMYLMSCPHGTIAGVFRLPDGYACEDLQWPPARVGTAFAALVASDFARRCEATKWVWIVKHFEWNPPENPNQRKACAKVAAAVPTECAWHAEFVATVAPYLGLEAATAKPWQTLGEALPNQEQKQEQDQEHQQEVDGARSAAPRTAPAARGAGRATTFRVWQQALRASGEKSIPDDDPILEYADDAGLPHEFLALAWGEFKARYIAEDKRYRDWRAVFRKAVRGNWLKLWHCNGSEGYVLTALGLQAQRAAQAQRGTTRTTA